MNYRLLNDDEQVIATDERWMEFSEKWVGVNIGTEKKFTAKDFISPVRRPIQEPKWEKGSDSARPVEYPCWIWSKENGVDLAYGWSRLATHWMPATIPPPPPPEVSDEEKAWQDLCGKYMGATEHAAWCAQVPPKDAFLAGIKWARGQK